MISLAMLCAESASGVVTWISISGLPSGLCWMGVSSLMRGLLANRGECAAEDVDRPAGLVLGDHAPGHDVHPISHDEGPDALLLAGAPDLGHLRAAQWLSRGPVRDELERPEGPDPADITHDLVLGEGTQPGTEDVLAQRADVLQDALLLHDRDGGDGG